MRLDLHPLHAPHARIGMAPSADHTARGLGVGDEGEHVTRGRRVRTDREGTVPQFSVQMLGVRAIDALAAAKGKVHRPPGGEERGEGAHVIGRDAAAAETRRDARITFVVEQPLGPDFVQLRGDGVQRLVPTDRHESGIVLASLLRVGALHRAEHPVGVVGFLHQAIGLDAALAAAWMHVRGAEVRLDLGGDAVLHLDRQQVGARHALVAVFGNLPDRIRHVNLQPEDCLALAATRARSFSTSTMKRPCSPRLISSPPSRASNSNVTLRPSTAVTVIMMSTFMPSRVAPLWDTEIPVPTESSPGSQNPTRNSPQLTSKSWTSLGVA